MRTWIDLMEGTAGDYITAANALIKSNFASRVDCDLSQSDSDTVEIEHIMAWEQRKGWGSEAMKALCHLADEMQVRLTLGVANESDDFYSAPGDPTEEDLIAFYEGFGFEVREGGWDERVRMDRTPS